jgi:ketosteroid isomerase-like protein
MTDNYEVRAASEKFYAGLNRMANGEVGALADSWSQSPMVTAMHPIGGRDIGWDAVSNAFNQVAGLASDGNIELKDQRIQVMGDVAYEVGVESGNFKLGGHDVELEHRVTNIYRQESGTWKVVHHHTDISPGLLDVLARLQN